MARYTGPKAKISRKFKEQLFGYSKAVERKPYGPGMHGNARRRGKQSEYAIQLAEKQKAKYTYGVLERQFYNTFEKASRRKGVTGENLLRLLEARLDNTVFRFGLANSRPGARQLVSHKHITVNGEVVNIPSYSLRPGDVVGVRERSKSIENIDDSLTRRHKAFPWLEWNMDDKQGRFVSYPDRDQIPENIKEQLIVELYSK